MATYFKNYHTNISQLISALQTASTHFPRIILETPTEINLQPKTLLQNAFDNFTTKGVLSLRQIQNALF